jgi:DNA polymerase-3 subunit beta
MKISLETAKITDIIDIVTRFVAKNATLPILQNMYLKASIDTLTLRATDMEKYIEVELPCTVQVEGAITINAKMFSDIIKTIEEKDIECSVDQKSQVMTIKSAKDTFEINGISASEYVALPDVPRDNTITLDTPTFAEGISKVEYAVTEKNFSPVLT